MISARRGLLILAFLWAITTPVYGHGTKASDPPHVSGPLIGSQHSCAQHEAPQPSQIVVQSCSWIYRLAPLHTRPSEDYEAYWVQLEIDPGRQTCAGKIVFRLSVPRDARILSTTPNHSSLFRSPRTTALSLEVDANGAAPIPGVIRQTFLQRRRYVRVRSDHHQYVYTWWGRSRQTVMAAIGMELSHDTVPPTLSINWSELRGSRAENCQAS